MRYRYNGGSYIHCNDAYIYILIYCYMFLHPLSPRKGFGL